MVATTADALKQKKLNKERARYEKKKANYKTNKIVEELLHEALASQRANFAAAVKRRKQKYDHDNNSFVKAIRNDAARWKKKFEEKEKEVQISIAEKQELKRWRMVKLWIKAHGHPRTMREVHELYKYGPPKGRPQYS